MRFFWTILLSAVLAHSLPTYIKIDGQQNERNGKDLKGLIECFTWWDPNSASRPGNSQLEGCKIEDIMHCKTDRGHDDVICQFHGDNHLTLYEGETPSCYFCCGLETCNSWDVANDEKQRRCIEALLTGSFSKEKTGLRLNGVYH